MDKLDRSTSINVADKSINQSSSDEASTTKELNYGFKKAEMPQGQPYNTIDILQKVEILANTERLMVAKGLFRLVKHVRSLLTLFPEYIGHLHPTGMTKYIFGSSIPISEEILRNF